MKRGICCIFLLGILSGVFSQSPYELSWKKDALFLGASVLGATYYFMVDPDKSMMEQAEIEALDPGDVNGFDRGALDNWSEQAHALSDVGMIAPAGLAIVGGAAIPLVSNGEAYWKDALALGVIWLESNLINLGATELVKTSVGRVRPYAYNEEVPMADKLADEDIKKSFFSGHTSISAVNSFFLAKVFADYYPDSKWKPLSWGLAAAVPAVTGYLRVRAGEHFPTDVIAGYAFGALVGYFVPHFHRIRTGTDRISMSFLPYHALGGNGLSMYLSFR